MYKRKILAMFAMLLFTACSFAATQQQAVNKPMPTNKAVKNTPEVAGNNMPLPEDNFKPGFIVGGQLGTMFPDLKAQENSADMFGFGKIGFGARAYVGWQFMRYMAVETGVSYYGSSDTSSGTFIPNLSLSMGSSTVIDLMAKLILPLGSTRANIFVRGGAAYVMHRITTTGMFYPLGKTFSNSAVRPTYGLGFGYVFDNGLGVDISWLGILGTSQTVRTVTDINHVMPTVNSIMLGVSYKFS